jgi:transposase
MAAVCREFGISRKTGYKIYERYKNCGIDGLNDWSRRPHRHANQLPFQIETLKRTKNLSVTVELSDDRRSIDATAMASFSAIHADLALGRDPQSARRAEYGISTRSVSFRSIR